jgi:hypothetical protein
MAQDVFDRQRVPIVICFLSEAWTVTRARETLRDAGARRPAECEDRRECLIVTAQSLKRELTDGAIIRVDREDGKMYARPAERMTPGTIGGNILRYFWDGYGRALYRSLSAEHQAEIRRDQAERDRNRAAKN